MKVSKIQDYGLLFAIISPLFSGVATIFHTGAAKLLTPLVLASFGGLITSAIIFSFILLSKEKINKQDIKQNSKDIFIMTFLRPVVGATIFAYGLSMTDAIKAIFFTKMEPYFVLGWNWAIKKEKFLKRHLILLAVHIVGVIILSTGGNFSSIGAPQIGDLLVVTAMGFSLYLIFMVPNYL